MSDRIRLDAASRRPSPWPRMFAWVTATGLTAAFLTALVLVSEELLPFG